MKIEDSNILMASARTFLERNEEKEGFTTWIDLKDHENPGDKISISQKAKCTLSDRSLMIDEIEADTEDKHEITLRELLVEILAGRGIKLLDVSEFQKTQEYTDEGQVQLGKENQSPEERAGWGVEYTHQSSDYEKEDVSYVAAGIIHTEDGKEIDFSLRLDMSRTFISHHNLNFRAGDAVLMDPLVVNFNGKASELTNTKFTFDLDSDGVEEDLPMIGPGSGLLALDLNKDGIINNGNELFGPHTGNGFAELSEYDEDSNKWIDENDSIYDRLSVWTMDDRGNDSLSGLKDRGIGAIYLGNLASEFSLKGDNNELMGQVSRTGVYLGENGVPGVIQQLDLVV